MTDIIPQLKDNIKHSESILKKTDIISQLKDNIKHSESVLKNLDIDILKLEKEIMALKTKRCYYKGRFDEANEAFNLINGKDEK